MAPSTRNQSTDDHGYKSHSTTSNRSAGQSLVAYSAPSGTSDWLPSPWRRRISYVSDHAAVYGTVPYHGPNQLDTLEERLRMYESLPISGMVSCERKALFAPCSCKTTILPTHVIASTGVGHCVRQGLRPSFSSSWSQRSCSSSWASQAPGSCWADHLQSSTCSVASRRGFQNLISRHLPRLRGKLDQIKTQIGVT